MGTLTFQVTDTTDGTETKTYANFSDADITKWIASNQSAANSSVNGTATRIQVIDYVIAQTVRGWISTTQSYSDAIAAAAAASAVQAISIT